MVLQSFQLGNLASLYMRIINSVVVVGLYYGFMATFSSIGPSYLLLLQAHIKAIEEGGEKEIEDEVAAATGFTVGQLLMFMSIYNTPLHLALGAPHTITLLVPCCFLLLYYRYNFEIVNVPYQWTRKNTMRNPATQCIFLINILFQLLNHFFFPSSMLARLGNIYMFRYNNKMLFVTGSFVGWFIGQLLFINWVRFVLVWLQENYLVRAKRYIFSNEYLFYVFRFYKNVLFDLRTSMNKFSSILVFFTCLCTFGRMPLPFLTYKIKPQMPKQVELIKTPEEKEAEKILIEKFYGKDISQLDIDKENTIPLWFDNPPLISILFDYNRWIRPMQYIGNLKFKNGVRNEMSQFYFDTCPNDGKLRISFSCPPSLASFWKMIQRKISFLTTSTTENGIYDELYDSWIYTNEHKMKSLRKEFAKRIAVLDKKGLEKINVFENKVRLCKNKRKKQYLPFRHDPFLNGSYRGIVKEMLIPEIRTVYERILSLKNRKTPKPRVLFSTMLLPIHKSNTPMLRLRPNRSRKNIPITYKVRYGIEDPNRIKNLIRINKIQILLGDDYSYYKSDHKIDRFFKKSLLLYLRYFLGYFYKDTIIDLVLKKSINSPERNELMKKVPRWLYILFYDSEEDEILEAREKAEKEYKEALKKEGVAIEEEEEEKTEGEIEAEKEGDIRDQRVRRTLHLQTKDKEGKVEREISLTTDIPGPQLRDLIKGSVRAQKRKTSVWLLWQTHEHSNFFLKRTDALSNKFVRFLAVIKVIFLKYIRKISEFELSAYYPSFADLFRNIEESGEEESSIDAEIDDYEITEADEKEARIREAELVWENIACGHILRCWLLIINLGIRRVIIQPLLIMAKNIGRMLLLQRPEFLEDFKEYEKERHLFCTWNGVPFSDKELPENWMEEGIQLKVVDPFRLKPWHRSRPSNRERLGKSFYLTPWILTTSTPFGTPEAPKIKPFFKPIFKKLYKISKKIRKHFAKWIFFIQNRLFNLNLFIQNGLEKRLLKKNLSNVNPNFELELRDKSSEIIKENDSIINNQMIHESSIESQLKNLPNYSLIQRRMKDLANKRSTIRNKMDQISKIFNISPNKKHYGVKRLESLQNFVQILKRRTARLIRKSGYFIKFFMEKIYVNLFLYIFNISRIYTQKFFLELKNIYGVDRTNRNSMKFISTIKKSHFLFSSLLSSKINKNSRSHSDLSFLSQAYVFYKISQAQLSNLYKLRSVFQYYGTSLFLKNEIKDYFGAQGVIHSELSTKKLPNSGMNQWKNWLNSNYQYGLSQKKWYELGINKVRNQINEYCRGKNNKKKWNSYEKEQLINSNYQNAKAPLLLLPDEQENWKKNLKYKVLSYKFLFHEDKKDLDSYRIPFQGNKNKELSYTKNYYKYFDTPKYDLIIYEKKKEIEEKEKEIYLIEKEIEEKEKEIFFDDEKNIFCDEIYQKEKEKYDQNFINRLLNQMKNFFNRMEMNAGMVSPRGLLEFWFFPEFVLLYNRYKIKPWTIPIDLLFSTYEYSKFQGMKRLADKKKTADKQKLADKNKPADKKKLADQKKPADKQKPADQKKPADKQKPADQKKPADKQKPAAKQKLAEHIIPGSYFLNYLQKQEGFQYLQKQESISMESNLINILPEFFDFQFDWLSDYEDTEDNFDRGILLSNLKLNSKKSLNTTLSFVKNGFLHLDIMLFKKKKDDNPSLNENDDNPSLNENDDNPSLNEDDDNPSLNEDDDNPSLNEDDDNLSLSKFLKGGIFTIEPIRESYITGSSIMYQMTGLSWVHKNIIKYQNNQKRFGDENNYDLLIPENILLPRRRRELRILSLLNSRNNKGVDKNPVYCSGNRVNKGSQFFDKSKDLDRDKKKLIKFFLWPNYRLEDLACMNRYWFDTNNGSRFSILRILMYPRLKTRL